MEKHRTERTVKEVVLLIRIGKKRENFMVFKARVLAVLCSEHYHRI